MMYQITSNQLTYDNFLPKKDPQTAFEDACTANDVDKVKEFLASGTIDPSANNNGAIIWACTKGYLQLAQELLKDPKVDPSACDNEAIVSASGCGRLEIVRLLLKDPRVNPTAQGNRAINNAYRYNHPEVAKELLKDFRVSFRYRGQQIAWIATGTLIGRLIFFPKYTYFSWTVSLLISISLYHLISKINRYLENFNVFPA